MFTCSSVEYINVAYTFKAITLIMIYDCLTGKSEAKSLYVRSRSRLEDNIKIVLKGIVCECVCWVNLAQDGVRSYKHDSEYLCFAKCVGAVSGFY